MPELALRTVENALTANPQELIWRAYTLTWRGELRLQQTDRRAMAEADFRNAIETSEITRAQSLAASSRD